MIDDLRQEKAASSEVAELREKVLTLERVVARLVTEAEGGGGGGGGNEVQEDQEEEEEEETDGRLSDQVDALQEQVQQVREEQRTAWESVGEEVAGVRESLASEVERLWERIRSEEREEDEEEEEEVARHEEIAQQVRELSGSVEDMRADIEELKEAKGCDGDCAEAAAEVGQVAEDNRGRIGILESMLAMVKGAIDGQDQGQGSGESAEGECCAGLGAEVGRLEGRLDLLVGELGGLTEGVTEEIGTLRAGLAELNRTQEEAAAAVDGRTRELSEEVAGLRGRLAAVEVEVGDNAARAEANSDSIEALREAIMGVVMAAADKDDNDEDEDDEDTVSDSRLLLIEDKLSQLSGDVSDLKSEKDVLGAMLDMVKASYVNDSYVTDLVTRVGGEIREDLRGLRAAVAEAEEERSRDLEELRGQVAGNTDEIAGLSATTGKTVEDVTEIRGILDAQGRNLSSASAMLAMVKQDRADTQEDLQSLRAAVAEAEEERDKELEELQGQVAGNADEIAGLSMMTGKTVEDITEIRGILDAQGRNLSSVGAMLAMVKANGIEMQATLTELRDDQEETATLVKEQGESVADNTVRLDDLEDMLQEVKASYVNGSALAEALGEQDSALSSVAAMVDEIKSDYVSVTTFADKTSETDAMLEMLKDFRDAAMVSLDNVASEVVEQSSEISDLRDRLSKMDPSLAMVLEFKAGTEEKLQQLMEAQEEVRRDVSGLAAMQQMLLDFKSEATDLAEELQRQLSNLSAADLAAREELDSAMEMLDAAKEELRLLGATLDAVKSDYVDEEALAQASAEAVEALESAREELRQTDLVLGDSLGILCAKVAEITDIRSPVHSSTSRRWFLEELKAIESPSC